MTIVDKAIALLKEKGYKTTPKRRAMLEAIAHANTFVSAKRVQDLLRKEYPSLSYDTVYRNLYTFVEHGILEMSERHGEKVFLIQCSQHAHHHHFICEACDKITEITMCPMDIFAKQLPNYVILGHKFEITGLCADCIEEEDEHEHHGHCSCGHHH